MDYTCQLPPTTHVLIIRSQSHNPIILGTNSHNPIILAPPDQQAAILPPARARPVGRRPVPGPARTAVAFAAAAGLSSATWTGSGVPAVYPLASGGGEWPLSARRVPCPLAHVPCPLAHVPGLLLPAPCPGPALCPGSCPGLVLPPRHPSAPPRRRPCLRLAAPT